MKRTCLIGAIGALAAGYVVIGLPYAYFTGEFGKAERGAVIWGLPICAAVAAVYLPIGIGLVRKRAWARKPGIILSVLLLLTFLSFTVWVSVTASYFIIDLHSISDEMKAIDQWMLDRGSMTEEEVADSQRERRYAIWGLTAGLVGTLALGVAVGAGMTWSAWRCMRYLQSGEGKARSAEPPVQENGPGDPGPV